MRMNKARKLALAAASQSADATAELLMFAREGALAAHGNFVNEPIERLADACKLALEAERASGRKLDDERGQLHAALCRYLDGWVS